MFICTAAHPWKPGLTEPGEQIQHPDAKELFQEDGWPAGDTVVLECPCCGHRWRMELPQ